MLVIVFVLYKEVEAQGDQSFDMYVSIRFDLKTLKLKRIL